MTIEFDYESERNFYRKEAPIIEKAKIMIAVLLIFSSIFMFAQKLVVLADGMIEDKVSGLIAIIFVIIGLLVFVE